MTLEARIRGIPCLVRVTRYSPGHPAIRLGPPDQWVAPDPADIEYEVLDQRGRPAPWLEAKITGVDDEAICNSIIRGQER